MSHLKVILLLIENRKGQTLFSLRSDEKEVDPRMWALPCEVVEKGESEEETIFRCGREDLGIDLAEYQVVDRFVTFNPDPRYPSEEKELIFVKTTLGKQSLQVDPNDIKRVVWEEKLQFLKTHANSKLCDGLRHLKSKLVKK